jgi:VIT1/CCC1 family predicted Fe2+/Mn2+ transporter
MSAIQAQSTDTNNATLGRTLVLDELFDLTLYRELRRHAGEDFHPLLKSLVPVETRHFEFWKAFFHVEEPDLDLWRRLKLRLIALFCRLFGPPAIAITLEAIELRGIKKYLRVWEEYRATPLGEAVRSILDDELCHEDSIVSQSITQQVRPERIRDVFLGLNDGLVEMVGAVSGFFAAFHSASAVLIAALTVAVAGAFSMAAGAFMGASSAFEIEDVEAGKRRFLGEKDVTAPPSAPFGSGLSVGLSYLVGALVPIAPVFFGATSLWLTIAVSITAVIVTSYVLAFLSGMDARRRILLNLLIASLAVAVTYAIGLATNRLFGITIS